MNPSDLTDEAGCRELCREYGYANADGSPHPTAMRALAEAVRMMREKATGGLPMRWIETKDGGETAAEIRRRNSADFTSRPELEYRVGYNDALDRVRAAIRALQLTAEDIKRGE